MNGRIDLSRGWLSPLLVSLATAWLGVGPVTAGAAPAPAPKISPEILAHQRMKRRPAGVSPVQHARKLRERGLDADRPDAEHCAIYVRTRLTRTEVDRLRPAGIEIDERRWVAPVPGRHPHGFHVARVPYEDLGRLDGDPNVVRVVSIEHASRPLNNVSRALLRIDDVHDGVGLAPLDGAGVRVAVGDSGLDVGHPDLPPPVEAFDVTDGTHAGDWGSNVANTVVEHGTHVTGSVVGSGALSAANVGNGGGDYRGAAPGALLHFYKIGNDFNAFAGDDDKIEAIQRAQQVGCRVFSLSYGGWDSAFLDGSSPVCQAIDGAAAAGMSLFASAGNFANLERHDSETIGPDGESAEIAFTISNTSGGSPYAGEQHLRVIWRDHDPSDNNIDLQAVNLDAGETLTEAAWDTSPRGTESKLYVLAPNIPAGVAKTFRLRFVDTAAVRSSPRVHLYRIAGRGLFDDADPAYTPTHPALCDGAIAVGAWGARREWTSFDGLPRFSGNIVEGTLAPFSSIGPRVDGRLKPEILGPGGMTISTRDGALAQIGALIVDDDGLALDGSGPANYYTLQGTSMAAPFAAGAAALLLQAAPGLTPAGVRNALSLTSSGAGQASDANGYGLLDARSAIESLPAAGTDLDGDWYPGSGQTAADCDDGDATIWGRPGEVPFLTFLDRITLSWQAPQEVGGSVAAYDVLRSSEASDFDAAAICIESSDTSDRAAADLQPPAPGQVSHYLVRARNDCAAGTGSVGPSSTGAERSGRDCGP